MVLSSIVFMCKKVLGNKKSPTNFVGLFIIQYGIYFLTSVFGFSVSMIAGSLFLTIIDLF